MTGPTCVCGDQFDHDTARCAAAEQARLRVIGTAARHGADQVAVTDLWAHLRKVLDPAGAAQAVSDVLDLGWRPPARHDRPARRPDNVTETVA